MTPVGLSKWVARAEAQLGEPIEAVCHVVPKGSAIGKLAAAASTGEATPVWWLVLTRHELLLFKNTIRRIGWTFRSCPGDELLRVSFSEIVHVFRLGSFPSIGFRLVLSDGRQVALGAVRIHRGRDVVERLIDLVARHRRPEQLA